jgi:hypothetical protein
MLPIKQSSKTPLPSGCLLPHGTDDRDIYKNRVTCLHVPCGFDLAIDSVEQTDVCTFLLRDSARGVAIVVELSFDSDVTALEIRLSRRAVVTARDGVVSFPVFIDGQSSVGTIMTVTAAPLSDPSQIFARGEFVLRAKITTAHDPSGVRARPRARSRKNEDRDFVVTRQFHVERPTRYLRSGAAFLGITPDEVDLFFNGVGMTE